MVSFFSTFEIYFRFKSCLKDCCYACCTVIGAMFCIITFPVIVYGCIEVFSQSEATTCFIMAMVLIIYIIFAWTVILGFKNLMCYKINGAVYNIDSDRIFNQNQNTEAQPARTNIQFPDMDLPPSYTECVILSPPNNVQFTDSAPPPPYYVWIEQFLCHEYYVVSEITALYFVSRNVKYTTLYETKCIFKIVWTLFVKVKTVFSQLALENFVAIVDQKY